MLPQLKARPKVYNNAMHQAREFIEVFNTNTANKIFQSDGTTEIEDDEEKAKQIARWVNYYKREEEKKAAKRRAESEVNESQKKVHLDDGMNGLLPPVPSAATAASNNFIANNKLSTLPTGGGMDTGGLQSQQLEKVHHHHQQQRESPTSALNFDHADASIKSLVLADDKVGTIGHLLDTGPAPASGEVNRQPYSPTPSLQSFDNFLSDMDAQTKRIKDLEQKLEETKAECGSKIDALEAKVVGKNSEVDRLAAKLDELEVQFKYGGF